MFFSIPNLSSHAVTPLDDPASLPSIAPIPKDERLKWQSHARTAHHFISGFEGAIPTGRVDKHNPTKRMYAFIADYDGVGITDEMLESAGLESFAATWTLRTMTPGRARLIWELDTPVWMPPSDKAGKAFMERLCSELKLEARLPGFDRKSLKTSQYFEIGREWKATGASRFPSTVVGGWLMDTALKSGKVWAEGPIIPLEIVAEQVEKTWPGRWKKEFTEGMRGPLFWVDPFKEESEGAIVMPWGMFSHSDRSEGSVTWRALLGDEFTRKWEADRVGAVAASVWYDKKCYWWKTEKGWDDRNKDDSIMRLKSLGFSGKTGAKETICEAERVLVAVQDSRSIDFAAPIVFEPGEVVDVRGDRVLNTSRRKVMEPAECGDPEKFPWLHEFFFNIWDDYSEDGVPQRDYFLAWFKRFWTDAREGRPSQGHLLVVAGKPSHGKTFLSRCIIGQAMGGSVDASDILQGATKFTKQAAEVAVWAIDDAVSTATHAAAVRFGENLKKQVANPTVMYQPKYKDALELPWKGRIVMTCNTDPDSLAIIPPLDNTIADKVMLLRCSDSWSPKFLGSNYLNESRVVAELPYFLAWLSEWKAPGEIMEPSNPRFGIKAIHHPSLKTAAREASSAHSTQEALELWREEYAATCGEDYVWRGSATALLAHITSSVPHVAAMLKQTNPRWFGKDLRKLMGVWPPLVKVANHSGISQYTIDVSIKEVA